MFNRKGHSPAMGIAIGIMLVAPGTLVNMHDISRALGNAYVPQFYVGYDQGLLDGNSGGLIFYTNLNNIDPGVTIVGSFGGGVYTPSEIAGWSVVVNGEQVLLFPNLTMDSTSEEAANALLEVGINGTYVIDGFFQAVDALDASYFTSYWPFAISYIGQVVLALLKNILIMQFIMFGHHLLPFW